MNRREMLSGCVVASAALPLVNLPKLERLPRDDRGHRLRILQIDYEQYMADPEFKWIPSDVNVIATQWEFFTHGELKLKLESERFSIVSFGSMIPLVTFEELGARPLS